LWDKYHYRKRVAEGVLTPKADREYWKSLKRLDKRMNRKRVPGLDWGWTSSSEEEEEDSELADAYKILRMAENDYRQAVKEEHAPVTEAIKALTPDLRELMLHCLWSKWQQPVWYEEAKKMM
jgi:hypothetical protein